MENNKELERVTLTYFQAVSMLPDGDKVHTFVQVNGVLIGCDWTLNDTLQVILENHAELSGTHASDMGHGIVVRVPLQGPIFIETRKDGKTRDPVMPSDERSPPPEGT